ncbi:MAG: histidine kinase [Pseudomonadota bacterium]
MPNSSPGLLFNPSRDKLQRFIAGLPGMACQIELQEGGSIAFTYVSEGCSALLGPPPEELLCDSSRFISLIHPEDIASFLETLQQSAQTLCFWDWQGRIVLPDNRIKWVSIGSVPQNSPNGLPSWQGMVLDVTESKLAELEIRRTQQQLQELTSHIQDAKEQERLHIAREVHDEIGSLLTAIRIDLSWLIQHLPEDDRLLAEKAKTIEELVNKAITSANNLAHSLRPGVLDHFGFIAAIEVEAQEFSKRSGISCALIAPQEDILLSPALSITLFRIFQEALNNILKHAKAKNAQIEVVKGTDHLELIISDDGVGISDTARNKPRSFGLRGIHERVAYLGGTVRIASSASSGTQIAIFVPLETDETGSSIQQQAMSDGTSI